MLPPSRCSPASAIEDRDVRLGNLEVVLHGAASVRGVAGLLGGADIQRRDGSVARRQGDGLCSGGERLAEVALAKQCVRQVSRFPAPVRTGGPLRRLCGAALAFFSFCGFPLDAMAFTLALTHGASVCRTTAGRVKQLR